MSSTIASCSVLLQEKWWFYFVLSSGFDLLNAQTNKIEKKKIESITRQRLKQPVNRARVSEFLSLIWEFTDATVFQMVLNLKIIGWNKTNFDQTKKCTLFSLMQNGIIKSSNKVTYAI